MADFNDEIEVTLTLTSNNQDEPSVISLGFAGAAPDGNAPLVSFALLSGTEIEKESSIVVSVTEDVALSAMVILAYFAASGAYEVVWDGNDFAAAYSDSARAAITDGYQYTLRRSNGWFVTPTIRVIAVDTAGNGGIPA